MKLLHRCCCFDIKSGSIIIGILGILFSIIGTIVSIVYFVNNNNRINLYLEKYGTHVIDVEEYHRTVSTRTTMGGYIIMCCLLFTVSFLLLYGLKKNKALFIVPWLVVNILLVIGYLLTFAFLSYKSKHPALVIGTIIGIIVLSVLHLYFLIVIYSIYKSIRIETAEEAMKEGFRKRIDTPSSQKFDQYRFS